VVGMLCRLGCWLLPLPPPLLPAATTTTAIMALAPINANPVRGSCAFRTPAERPGFSGPFWFGFGALAAASAACAGRAGANKAAITTKIVKYLMPPICIPKRLFRLPI